MAAAGDPSKFSTNWCNDGGANRSISNDITDFASNYRTVSINITVAKQNVSMQDIGIGDCLLHCTTISAVNANFYLKMYCMCQPRVGT